MSEKRKNGFEKMPWGIFAGISAMIWSFVTVGIVVVLIVSSMMIAEVGGDDGLSQSWWVIILYVLEALTVVGFILCVVLCAKRKKRAADSARFAVNGATAAESENVCCAAASVENADDEALSSEIFFDAEPDPIDESVAEDLSAEGEETSEDSEAEDLSDTSGQADADDRRKKKTSAKKYHISQREDGKWRVRREGSDKVLKLFDTQKQAIEYAKTVADNQSGSIVIHKVDGKIRKQKY